MLWARGCVRRRGLDSSCWSCFMKTPKIQLPPATKATPHHKESLNNVAVFKGQWWSTSHINQLLNSSHFESSVWWKTRKRTTRGNPLSLWSSDGERFFPIYIWFLECTARISHECFIARTSKNVCHSLTPDAIRVFGFNHVPANCHFP